MLISQIHPISPKVILLTGDAIKTGRRCLFGLSVYIFVTYEFSGHMDIDDKPEPMPTPLNYPA